MPFDFVKAPYQAGGAAMYNPKLPNERRFVASLGSRVRDGTCADGLDNGDGLDGAGGAQQVPQHALAAVDAHLRPRHCCPDRPGDTAKGLVMSQTSLLCTLRGSINTCNSCCKLGACLLRRLFTTPVSCVRVGNCTENTACNKQTVNASCATGHTYTLPCRRRAWRCRAR